eukprot:SAG22_NODE_15252_length_353_cov_0.842520_1_plen_50_part_01
MYISEDPTGSQNFARDQTFTRTRFALAAGPGRPWSARGRCSGAALAMEEM